MSKLRVTPMQLKTKAQFRASLQSNGTLELLVYEDIGENWWDGSGVTAKAVKQELDANPNYSRISIRINSPGGDAFEGIAILNLLKAQQRPVDVSIDGIAASAASLVAMAGSTITMGSSAMMMIHNAWTVCMGDGDDMRKCGDTLDRISESVGQAYVDKTGKSAKEVKALMDAETWMGAQECVDNGFATAVASDSDDNDAMALAKSFRSLAKMKHLPEQLKTAEGPEEKSDGADVDDPAASNDPSGVANGDPAGVATVEDSNLSQYEARLSLLTKV
jgi:ATP-dependent protease ClpP protease subunit